MRLNILFVSLLVLFFLLLNLPHLLELTPVWPDEAVASDIALNILKNNKISTEIWTGSLHGVTQHVFWYPSVFFYLLSFWFKFFGFSIMTQRIFSIVITSSYILVFFLFLKFLIKISTKKLSDVRMSFFAFLTSLTLVIDPIFLKSSVIGRPEMLVLILLFSAAIIILKAFNLEQKTTERSVLIAIGAFLTGLLVLVHFLSAIFLPAFAIYLIIERFKKNLLNYEVVLFISLSLLPSLVWFFTILPDFNILLSQLSLFAKDRILSPRWLNIIFSEQNNTNRFVIVVYALISMAVFFVFTIIKKVYLFFIALLLLLAWVLNYFFKVEWYSIYIAPFVYIVITLLFVYSSSLKGKSLLKDFKFLSPLILFILLIIGINNSINLLSISKDKSYLKFQQSLRSVIPKGKSVLVSSFPDSYFALGGSLEYKIYENPFIMGDTKEFRNLLTQLDYVVINSPLVNPSLNEELSKLLQKNSSNSSKISAGGYTVFVYKLK